MKTGLLEKLRLRLKWFVTEAWTEADFAVAGTGALPAP
jgi:hypothetical protein